jgi:predicted RNA binding protein YcfA (HicA-like mRNA interferase family)
MSLSGKEALRLLKKHDWKLQRITGSHHTMIKGNKAVSVPVHGNKAMGKGLETKIFKQAGIKK